MKKLLGILVLGLFLITSSQAEDIRDFEIEGFSIGDSLLYHMSEEDIKNEKKYYYSASKKFFGLTINTDSSNYDIIQMSVTNDKKYIIHSLSGKLFYINNFEECKKKMNLIIRELTNSLPENIKVEDDELLKMPADKTGRSVNKGTTFWFQNNDYIVVECSDWTDEMEYKDNLKVRFSTKFYNEWLLNEAYD